MSLVVEDGTGKTTSNSYISLDDSDTYHEDRYNTSWYDGTYTDDQKSAALIRAAAYIDSLAFRGVRYSADQAMAFPREALYDDDGYLLSEDAIPTKVIHAQCEAALIEVASAGALMPSLEHGGSIKRKRVDVLETEYFEGSNSATTYSIIKRLLRGLLEVVTVSISRA